MIWVTEKVWKLSITIIISQLKAVMAFLTSTTLRTTMMMMIICSQRRSLRKRK
jgi:hypothetical protein